MGGRLVACIAVLTMAAGLVATPAAEATFHEILVREVYAGGAADDSYVVLQAYSSGQNLLSGHAVTAYDSTGAAIGAFTFSSGVANSQNQMTVLVADSAYATGFPSGPAPDRTAASFNLDAAGGAICWAGLDCMSWGNFSGSTVPASGSPADPSGIPANNALRRTIAPNCSTLLEAGDDTNVSATDFHDGTPSPRANSSTISETGCAPSTAPNTTIVDTVGDPKPAARTNATEAKFSFTATPPTGATFECKLDAEPSFSSCTSPASYTGLTGGAGTAHTFQVRAVHPANGTDPSPASYAWTIDTVAPTATIDTHPGNSAPGTSSAFAFHASETSTFKCSLALVGAPDEYSSCSSVKTYSSRADGEYTFRVRAVDQATNVGAADSFTWSVDNSLNDTTTPQTTIDSRPADPSASSTVAFTYGSNEAGSSFECALDGAGFSACPAPGISYSGLANGPHSFQVRAIDASANVDPTPAGYSFGVAVEGLPAPAAGSGATPPAPALPPPARPATAPQTVLTKPAAKTHDRTPGFRFRSDSAAAKFECAVDKQAFKPCRSPFTTRSLKPGRHTFLVRAVAGGLTDSSPAKFAFKVVQGK